MKSAISPRRGTSRIRAKAILVAIFLALPLIAASQQVILPAVPVDGSISIEQLEQAVRAVEATQDLNEETRASVTEQLLNAITQERRRAAAEAEANAYTGTLDTAPAELEALRTILAEAAAPAPTADDFGITDDTALTDLEQALTKNVTDLATVDARISTLEAQIRVQETRPADARQRMIELQGRRDELVAIIAAAPATGEQQILTDARKLAAELRRAAQSAEINSLEQESLSHSNRLALLKAQRDVAIRSRVGAARRVELFRTMVNEKRQAAAQLAQESAAATAVELAAAGKHALITDLAEANANLTGQLPAVAAEIERTTAQLDRTESERRNLEQRLARSTQKLEVGGLSRVIGRLLIEERRSLPQVSQYRSDVRARRDALAEIGLAQVRIQEQRRELTPVDERVAELVAGISDDMTAEEELESIREEVRLLMLHRRELLNQAEDTYRSYLQVLGDLDIAHRQLLDSAALYNEFLNQNLMWIPSAPILGTGDIEDMGQAVIRALDPASWRVTIAELFESLREHVTAAIFTLLLLTGLLIVRRPFAAHFKAMSSKVGRLSTDNIGLTLISIIIAGVRALPLPLLLGASGWFLENGTQTSAFTASIARGLLAVAPFLYNVLLFRVLCAENGVGRIHIGWRKENLAIIRRQLDRLVAIAAPLVFITVMFYASEVATDRSTMGRLVFIVLMVVLAWVVHPITHPYSGVVSTYYRSKPSSWLSRLRWLWYALTVGGPLSLGLIAILGYLYTSAILTGLLVDTIWLSLAILVVNMVILRWLALARRKLAWQIAVKEREERKAQKDEEQEAEADGELPVIESQPLDLDAVDQQTQKLLQAGLFLVGVLAAWGIWAEVLPAFNLLEQVSLWSKTAIIDGVETIAPVTLADLLLALLVAAVTAIASKNLPGLMEIVVLQRITLQPGSRYAINTMVRYVVVTTGVIVVLNIVGWNWSQIQWLVAALSVGLGFGLQEIVANFVSGLVILFERPIRVGDTVTVGALSGKVSRVRIRATTITDWDRKEIIVPNKAFITEQVVNWTLSDPITRVVIPVGISYGSDVELAHTVMADTLKSLPLVLEEPPPKVYFIGFGDSSLDFKLHAYSRQLTDRLPLMHAVHNAILRALREHDVEIPFPQRDLHVRSTVEND